MNDPNACVSRLPGHGRAIPSIERMARIVRVMNWRLPMPRSVCTVRSSPLYRGPGRGRLCMALPETCSAELPS